MYLFPHAERKSELNNERRKDMAELGHGGKEIVERIMAPAEAAQKIKGLKEIPIRSQLANEVIDISLWFVLAS